jgi:hypothetical protein
VAIICAQVVTLEKSPLGYPFENYLKAVDHGKIHTHTSATWFSVQVVHILKCNFCFEFLHHFLINLALTFSMPQE